MRYRALPLTPPRDSYSDQTYATRRRLCHSPDRWNLTCLLRQSLRVAGENRAICRADVCKNHRRARGAVPDTVVSVSLMPVAVMHEHGWNADHADIAV
jgi:hypothetical protein